MRQAFKLIYSLSSFAFTMILSLFAFTYTAIHFPSTMRDCLAGAQHLRDQISLLSLPDSYMVWVDIFLQPNQIVLVLFSITMRLAMDLVGSLFGGWSYPEEPDRPSRPSYFLHWGGRP